MHVMVVTYGEPKKGYLNFTLGNLGATQPIALLIWPPLQCRGVLPSMFNINNMDHATRDGHLGIPCTGI